MIQNDGKFAYLLGLFLVIEENVVVSANGVLEELLFCGLAGRARSRLYNRSSSVVRSIMSKNDVPSLRWLLQLVTYAIKRSRKVHFNFSNLAFVVCDECLSRVHLVLVKTEF